jgi:hypothetical protein
MIKNALLTALIMSCLSACGEISYKMGGSARDVENAHAACRGVAEADLSLCLEKQGWKPQKFDDEDLFAVASVTDNRPSANINSAKVKPTIQTEQNTVNVVEEKTVPSLIADKPINDNKTYHINSWWKMGGSDKQLNADMQTCSQSLDQEHVPDMKQQIYTRLFIVCMREHGWMALTSK